jgi:hypothetical protein
MLRGRTQTIQRLDLYCYCERSLGTGFQLPSQDAIYNQDEEKRKKSGSHLALFGFAHGPQGCEGKRLGHGPSHVTSGSARYSYSALWDASVVCFFLN